MCPESDHNPLQMRGRTGHGTDVAGARAEVPWDEAARHPTLEPEAMTMWSLRNLGGISLFLFGTTFLWLTPAFASRGIPTTGALGSSTRGLAMLTRAGFTVATWGLYQRSGWWLPVAVVSSVVGLVTLVPYWLAASRSGETTPGFNVLIHAAGSVSVLALLLVPSLQRWVQAQVMGS